MQSDLSAPSLPADSRPAGTGESLFSRLFCFEALIFINFWLAFHIGGSTQFFQDPDTFWHTVVGQQILTTRGFFDTDEFSYSQPQGNKWVPHQWVGEILMGIFDWISGLDGLLWITTTVIVSVFTWLGSRLYRCGMHPILALLFVALGVAGSSHHFHVRPHLMTIFGLAMTFAILCDVESGRRPLRHLLWLWPLMWLWSNTHGGVLGGMVSLAMVVGGWTLWRLLRWDSPIHNWRDFGFVVLIGLGCGVTPLLNPYGYHLPMVWFDIYNAKLLTEVIQEHLPMTFDSNEAWMILTLGLVYFGLLLSSWPRAPRVVWLVPFFWFLQSYLRIRHAPLFAVTALVALADLFPLTRLVQALLKSKSDWYTDVPRPRFTWLGLVLPGLLIFSVLGLQSADRYVSVSVPWTDGTLDITLGRGAVRLHPEWWPTELDREIAAFPPGARVFTSYGCGSYLIYHKPGTKIFIDGRAEFYGEQFVHDYIKSDHESQERATRQFLKYEENFGPCDYALLDRYSNYANFLRIREPAWQKIGETAQFVLFKR